jgi:hypothetical protein
MGRASVVTTERTYGHLTAGHADLRQRLATVTAGIDLRLQPRLRAGP